MMNVKQITAKYGQPGDPANLATIKLPYPMIVALVTNQTVTHIQCHKLIGGQLLAVFNDLLAHYGLEKIQELALTYSAGRWLRRMTCSLN